MSAAQALTGSIAANTVQKWLRAWHNEGMPGGIGSVEGRDQRLAHENDRAPGDDARHREVRRHVHDESNQGGSADSHHMQRTDERCLGRAVLFEQEPHAVDTDLCHALRRAHGQIMPRRIALPTASVRLFTESCSKIYFQ